MDYPENQTTTTNLLNTKVHIPSIIHTTVYRKRLFNVLEKGLHTKLTLVRAPSGYGKSTLLSQWIKKNNYKACWVSLDINDNNPSRFFSYLIHALRSVKEDIGYNIELLLKNPQVDYQALVSSLIEEIFSLKETVILILDDYHIIRSEEVHNIFKSFIDYLPANFHIYIASRVKIGIPISKLRVSRQLTEINETELKFTKDEIQLFFQSISNLNISETDLKLLEAQTEGWVASLQLIALSLDKEEKDIHLPETYASSKKYVVDYLVEEVLDKQEKSIKDFILNTSVLKSLNASLCAFVTGNKEANQVINYLEQENLFLIPLDSQHQWYRYHHMFAEVVGLKLQKDNPALVKALHLKASEWYDQNNYKLEAVDHAFLANDKKAINELIEKYMLPKILKGELSELFEWFDRMSVDNISSPMVKVWMAWIYIFSEQMDMVYIEKFLNIIEDELKHSPEYLEKYPEINIHILAIKGFIASHLGDIETGVTLCQKALNEFPESQLFLRGTIAYNIVVSFMFAANIKEARKYFDIAIYDSLKGKSFYGAITSIFYKGLSEIIGGKLKEAEKTYNNALRMSEEYQLQNLPFNAYSYIGLGIINLEWNRYDLAEQQLKKGIELGEAGSETMSTLTGYITLSQLYQAKENKLKALETINLAKNFADKLSVPFRKFEVEAIEAGLHLAQGNMEFVNEWAKPFYLIHKQEYHSLSELQALIVIRLFIYSEELDKAFEMIEWVEDQAIRRDRYNILIKALILKAIILYKSSKKEKALDHLQKALSLSEKEGFQQTFLQEGKILVPLLEKISHQNTYIKYAQHLLAILSQNKKISLPNKELKKYQLSNRELEVLFLVNEGLSNKEIADKLFITTGTIKRHLHNAFEKLGVKKRIEAVNKIKSLALGVI